jgi:hypothetical protein
MGLSLKEKCENVGGIYLGEEGPISRTMLRAFDVMESLLKNT